MWAARDTMAETSPRGRMTSYPRAYTLHVCRVRARISRCKSVAGERTRTCPCRCDEIYIYTDTHLFTTSAGYCSFLFSVYTVFKLNSRRREGAYASSSEIETENPLLREREREREMKDKRSQSAHEGYSDALSLSLSAH